MRETISYLLLSIFVGGCLATMFIVGIWAISDKEDWKDE